MTNLTSKPNIGFSIIGVISLGWNLMGVAVYILQVYMTDKMIAALPVAEQELYANVPAWVTAVFAIAVFGGALGSIVLLARKKIATTIFTISFVAIIAQMIYNFFLSNTMEVYGPGGMIMPIMVIIIGIFLIWYAKYSTKKEWLS